MVTKVLIIIIFLFIACGPKMTGSQREKYERKKCQKYIDEAMEDMRFYQETMGY